MIPLSGSQQALILIAMLIALALASLLTIPQLAITKSGISRAFVIDGSETETYLRKSAGRKV
ncbi:MULTISPECIES: hypothetical protein [Acidithrix]|uniref:hypothetical protein n=1 Tax=Acidithrix TaxID=1609233 RepID=UPI000697F68B|nr:MULTISPECIES: hypothetical protein [Acidithrix]CAG4925834.1 unnamed protein product [Acidithrix sp. C25]